MERKCDGLSTKACLQGDPIHATAPPRKPCRWVQVLLFAVSIVGILIQSLLVGLCALAVYELTFPVCKNCQHRTRRWQSGCLRCEQSVQSEP